MLYKRTSNPYPPNTFFNISNVIYCLVSTKISSVIPLSESLFPSISYRSDIWISTLYHPHCVIHIFCYPFWLRLLHFVFIQLTAKHIFKISLSNNYFNLILNLPLASVVCARITRLRSRVQVYPYVPFYSPLILARKY